LRAAEQLLKPVDISEALFERLLPLVRVGQDCAVKPRPLLFVGQELAQSREGTSFPGFMMPSGSSRRSMNYSHK